MLFDWAARVPTELSVLQGDMVAPSPRPTDRLCSNSCIIRPFVFFQIIFRIAYSNLAAFGM